MIAQYPGTCSECGERYPAGTDIRPHPTLAGEPTAWGHSACPSPDLQRGEAVCRVCFLVHPEGACDRD